MTKLSSWLKSEEKIIIALLREEYIQASSLLESGEINQKRLIRLIGRHWIAPVMAKRLNMHLADCLSNEIRNWCRKTIMTQLCKSKVQQQELAQAGKLLEAAEIPVIALKGPALDREKESLRVSFDVDFLIKNNDLKRTINLFEKEGYRYKGSFVLSRKEKTDIVSQLLWNNQYPFSSPYSSFSIEVHNNLFESDRIRLENLDALLNNSALFWENAVWAPELHCLMPSAEASLVLLCLHCSLKRSPAENQFVLRHILDMETLLLKGIDRKRLVYLGSAWKVSYHISFSLCLYIMFMGEEKSGDALLLTNELETVLNKKEKFLRDIHLSCVKNLRRSTLRGRFLYKLFMPMALGGGRKKTVTWYLKSIFPTKVELENRLYIYGFRKESPIIYLGYLINPFQFMWRQFKRFIHK